MTIPTVLTAQVWKALTAKFGEVYGTDSNIYTFLDAFDDEFYDLVSMDYQGLKSFDMIHYTTNNIVNIAFLRMGDAFKRIFDSLILSYDPLENFFTDGTFEKKGKETMEKKGTEKTTPTGKVEVSRKGETHVENEDSFTVGQGSTFDSATTTPPTTTAAASDLYNIARNINKQKTKQVFGDNGNNLPTTTTEYKDNYNVAKSFEGRKDELSFNDRIDETHKSGNSGIFSKQDLLQREIKLRLKNRIVPIYIGMVVDCFTTGAWIDSEVWTDEY